MPRISCEEQSEESRKPNTQKDVSLVTKYDSDVFNCDSSALFISLAPPAGQIEKTPSRSAVWTFSERNRIPLRLSIARDSIGWLVWNESWVSSRGR